MPDAGRRHAMLSPENTYRVIAIALASRTLVFLSHLVLNLLIPDHTSADAFRLRPARKPSILDTTVSAVFAGLNHWDAQYFLHVAERGYDTEDKLVFLPLFPLSLRPPAYLLQTVSYGYLNTQTSLVISAFLVNTTLFVLAAVALLHLTFLLFNDAKFSEEAVLWFSFNPASIFFSASYSEPLFSFLTFTGLYFLESGSVLLAASCFSLSSLTRSNGLVNVGFLVYCCLRHLADGRRSKVLSIAKTLIGAGVVVTPFLWFQLQYIPSRFCPAASFCQDLGFHSLPYSHLQGKYWNQGFLRYWHWRQTHNFLIGGPIILFCLASGIRYGSRLKDLLTQGLVWTEKRLWSHPRMLPYACHVCFLSLFALFFMHVQVAVRLISSSTPWIYWVAASLETNSRSHRVVRHFSTAYFFLGIALFANGLTWT